LELRRRILATLVDCRLKLSEIGCLDFNCARIVLVVREQSQHALRFENPRGLSQKFRPHHSPLLVAALWPRIRKEDVDMIGAQFGQLSKGFQTVAVDNHRICKPKSRDLFSRFVDALPLPLDAKKVREGISSRHCGKETSLVTSHIDLKWRRASSPPTLGKQVRRRSGQGDRGMRSGSEEPHVR
jgi:hypothetical protein